MWPTSIAVVKLSFPPSCGHVSSSPDWRRSAKLAWKSRPRLDAAEMPAVAVRARDELPVAQRLVGDDLAP